MQKQRLDKLIASQGTQTRTQVKAMLKKGSVSVNNAVVKIADFKVDAYIDVVCIAGKKLSFKQHTYLMMNKPQGVVSASRDNSKTVIDLVPDALKRKGLFPAGRLDKDTEGFMLITDDGEFAHAILSPKNHVSKTYIAIVDGCIDEQIIDAFKKGVVLDGEDICMSSELTVLEAGENGTKCKIIIFEGMYHQIKRMFARFGRTVTYLKRIKIGALNLDILLNLGECREINDKELALIKQKNSESV